jgi:hypothetical protein
MLRYIFIDENRTKVTLDGKYVGNILAVNGGFKYFPKGKPSDAQIFPKLSDCKKSLESN